MLVSKFENITATLLLQADVLAQVLYASQLGMIALVCVCIPMAGPSYCGVGGIGGGFVMPFIDSTIASMVGATIFLDVSSLGLSTTLRGVATWTQEFLSYSNHRACFLTKQMCFSSLVSSVTIFLEA